MIKGNMVIGQSGGPTAVINASLAGAYSAAKQAGVPKIYGMTGGVMGLIEEKYIDLGDFIKTEEDIKILCQTPSAALGSCRYKLPELDEKEVYEKLFKVFEKLDIVYFVYIGGNDSMDTIAKLSAYGRSVGSEIRFMGVPKTVDNDLPITDHTPGFASAAKYITTCVKEIICDSSVYDIKSITVIEIMGRNAGWLTASAALAKSDDCCGVDMIYLPEYSFDIDECKERTAKLLESKNTVVIAVSEALRDENGEYIAKSGSVHAGLDAFGHKIMSGTGQFLAQYLGKTLGVKARGIEINTLQRCAAHLASAQDVKEAFEAGCTAAKAALAGDSGKMAVIKRVADKPYEYLIDTADIDKIANVEKKIPLSWIDRENCSVTQEFINYLRPLIQGELKLIMKDGLPRHMKLR